MRVWYRLRLAFWTGKEGRGPRLEAVSGQPSRR